MHSKLSDFWVRVMGRTFSWFGNPILSLDNGGQDVKLGVTDPETGLVNRFTSGDARSTVPVTDAPPSGQSSVLTDIRFSSDTAMQLDFTDSGTGSVLFTEFVGANSSGQITLRGRVKLTPDSTLNLTASATGNISVLAAYFSEHP